MYSVCLRVTNVSGSVWENKTDYITVELPPEPLDANFTSNVTSGYAPLVIQFTDLSTGAPTAWNWSFGDGTWFNTTDELEKNASHTYTRAGSYDVQLLVTDPSGSDRENRSGYISVFSSELLTITSPLDDTVASGNITVAGIVGDPAVSNVTLDHNGVSRIVPVQNGNFLATVNLSAASTIIVTAVDSGGNPQSVTLLLDGDMLPAAFEQAIGFDPLNADSDCSEQPGDQSGNGIIDGYEVFDGNLPVFAKYRIGVDPFLADTDGDGLTDAFELLHLGLLTDPTLVDTDGNGAADAEEDLDGDSLTNLQEQTCGTDPLLSDTDSDTLDDGVEIAGGTNPSLADTDSDGLRDDSEVRLGANPNLADTDGDGTPDGDETYTKVAEDPALGVTAEVTGTGDLAAHLLISNVTSPIYTGTPALVGPVVDLRFSDPQLNGTVAPALVTLPYNPALVNATANISVFTFNDTIGTYEPVNTTVDTGTGTVSANVSVPATLAVFDTDIWAGMFLDPREQQQAQSMALQGGGSNLTDPDDILTTLGLEDESWTVRLTTSQLRTLDVYWFNGSASFPEGVYQIDCSGAYNNAVLASWIDWRIGAKAAWDDYGNLMRGMTVRYSDSSGYRDTLVSDLVVSAPVLQFTHAGGKIGMWNYDTSGTSNNAGDVTYTLRFYQDIDTDSDGIPDWLEEAGWWDGYGNQHFTDPNSADSDGDGLTDGEEAGRMVMVDGKIYFVLMSDPNSTDGDGDGIDDIVEIKETGTDPLSRDTDRDGLTDSYELANGTNPFNPDSDGDGWIDSKDGEPLDATIHAFDTTHIAKEFVLGFTLGSYGAENHDNSYYELGSLLSGIAIFGDIRDAGVAISQGNKQEAMLCIVGLCPVGGDAGKVLGKITHVALHEPQKLRHYGVYVAKIARDQADETRRIAVLDEVYSNSATLLRTTHGAQTDELVEIIDRQVDLNDVRRLVDDEGASYTGVRDAVSANADFYLVKGLYEVKQYNSWSKGPFPTAQDNKEYHFEKHGKDFGFSGDPENEAEMQEYFNLAADFMKRRDGSVEVYYQTDRCNLAIYDRANNWFGTANEKGEIQTFFKPKPEEAYVDGNAYLIKLN